MSFFFACHVYDIDHIFFSFLSKVECSNLQKQIDFFNLTVNQDLSPTLGKPSALKSYLSDAVFFISIGVNDFVFTYPTVFPKVMPSNYSITSY